MICLVISENASAATAAHSRASRRRLQEWLASPIQPVEADTSHGVPVDGEARHGAAPVAQELHRANRRTCECVLCEGMQKNVGPPRRLYHQGRTMCRNRVGDVDVLAVVIANQRSQVDRRGHEYAELQPRPLPSGLVDHLPLPRTICRRWDELKHAAAKLNAV